MPQYVMEEEEDLTLPEDSIHEAVLQEIREKEFTWNDRKTGEEKTGKVLEWWWEITSTRLGPKYIGRKVKGECNARITSRDGNRFREWSEVLLDREIPIGMGIDTDDLVGLRAEVVIGHRPDRKDPKKKWEYVESILPLHQSGESEPPF